MFFLPSLASHFRYGFFPLFATPWLAVLYLIVFFLCRFDSLIVSFPCSESLVNPFIAESTQIFVVTIPLPSFSLLKVFQNCFLLLLLFHAEERKES